MGRRPVTHCEEVQTSEEGTGARTRKQATSKKNFEFVASILHAEIFFRFATAFKITIYTLYAEEGESDVLHTRAN